MPEPPPAVHRAILAVDVENFGDAGRTNPDQVEVRSGLYRSIRRAFEASGVPWAACHHEDRGDGVLILVPPDVPKIRLADPFPRELADSLAAHNATCGRGGRIRLRIALHAGEVHFDDHGVAGTAINLTFRLLESPALKAALTDSPGVLALMASEWFFDEVIRHDRRSRPGTYRRMRVSVKETVTTGRVCLPDHPYPPAEEPDASPVVPHGRTAGSTVGHPATWNVPSRNRSFVGREGILARLSRILLAPDDRGATPACVVHGMGGVGKTQIAREYAHRHGPHYDGVWWVDAGQPFSVAQGLTELADHLGIPGDGARRRANALWRELASRGRWLVIYDNAEDQRDLQPWWPTAGVGGVLVTSRTSSWSIAHPVPAPPFTRAESIALLSRDSGQDDMADAGKIADELGHLPLALEQAAAYVARNRTSWTHYHDLLRRSPARMMHVNGPDDYSGTAATTWSLSMSRVREQHSGAAHLLKLYGFFDPDHIPRDLVGADPRDLPSPLAELATDRVAYDQAIGALAEYALVDATPETVSVHRLVQTMVRQSLLPEEQGVWAGAAALLLAGRFPATPRLPDSWRACGRLLPHVAQVAAHARRGLIAPVETSDLCQRAAAYLEVRAQHRQALDLLDHALPLREHAFGRDSDEYAETITSRGEVTCYLGHHRQAVDLARSALTIRERLAGPGSPSLVPTLRLLGRALTEAGRPAEAVVALEQAVGICVRAFGRGDARTAEAIARLAYAHWRGGDLDLARAGYAAAHEVWATAGTAPGRERTVAYRWMGAVLCDLGELIAARDVLEKATAMAHHLYGRDHVETVRAEEVRGIVLARMGEPAEAERLQRRAARFIEEFYPVPVVLAGTLTDLARTLLIAGRTDDALATAERAVRLYVEGHGTTDHPYNAGALTVLGMARRRLGRLDEAVECFERARQIYERSNGPRHLLTELREELAMTRAADAGNDAAAAEGEGAAG
ncbi:FxSxx-COOH system tetratricopeptide repeat protein [Actinomadura alba]|uniref:Tetratricopeptide repeat protein n=1 Tax=Actinomadura alba TaxID=406431 RepID=A0ABR7LLK2_9ACTN|nr:FxSxx-COOH system tetratricopeptide repeat protein [Actinomadura alba]MBC6465709.1 tetratricopeptide repeat protein [Actinomadura alba]